MEQIHRSNSRLFRAIFCALFNSYAESVDAPDMDFVLRRPRRAREPVVEETRRSFQLQSAEMERAGELKQIGINAFKSKDIPAAISAWKEAVQIIEGELGWGEVRWHKNVVGK